MDQDPVRIPTPINAASSSSWIQSPIPIDTQDQLQPLVLAGNVVVDWQWRRQWRRQYPMPPINDAAASADFLSTTFHPPLHIPEPLSMTRAAISSSSDMFELDLGLLFGSCWKLTTMTWDGCGRTAAFIDFYTTMP